MKRRRAVLFRHPGRGKLVRGHLVRTTIWNGERRVVVLAIGDTMGQIFKKCDEGVLWAYGWSSARANALEVAYTLCLT